jgi:hypothetical protein
MGALKFCGHETLNEWENHGHETGYVLVNSNHFFGMTYCGQHKMVFIHCLTSRNELIIHQTWTVEANAKHDLHIQSALFCFLRPWG